MGKRLTTAEAAALLARHLGREEGTPGALHSLASRARAAGTELHAPREVWPDGRTPLWEEDALLRHLACRPGRGANLRKRPAPEPAPPCDVPGQLTLPSPERSESNGAEGPRGA